MQVLGIEAERLNDQVGLEPERRARDDLGRLPPAGVGSTQPHAVGTDRRDPVLAEECLRRRHPDELDALLFGVRHLAHRARHVGAVATVEALDRPRALANGGAHAVHRRVAAADHGHMLPRRVQGTVVIGGDLVAEALAVGSGQVGQRRHDAAEAAARCR
jgi:hypothetical protein